MHDPENNPTVLEAVANEFEAAMIVSALAAHEIDASTSGSYTAGFRAEAPGDVQVLVRGRDLETAQRVLKELRDDLPENSSEHSSNQSVPTGIQWDTWHVVGFLGLLAGSVLYLCS